jgi:hybrid cluster-associated redox disulfide protein
MKSKIKKEMLIAEIVENYPQITEVLIEEYGLHCIGCMGAGMETLEQGSMAHGMTAKEIVTMVKKLNELI